MNHADTRAQAVKQRDAMIYVGPWKGSELSIVPLSDNMWNMLEELQNRRATIGYIFVQDATYRTAKALVERGLARFMDVSHNGRTGHVALPAAGPFEVVAELTVSA